MLNKTEIIERIESLVEYPIPIVKALSHALQENDNIWVCEGRSDEILCIEAGMIKNEERSEGYPGLSLYELSNEQRDRSNGCYLGSLEGTW